MPAKIVWLKAKCPVCGKDYDYIEGGYKPSTCNNFDCVHKFHCYPKYQEKNPEDVKQ